MNGASATTADVENDEIVFDVNVFQSPVSERGVGHVHDPEKESSTPSGGFPDLLHGVDRNYSAEHKTNRALDDSPIRQEQEICLPVVV